MSDAVLMRQWNLGRTERECFTFFPSVTAFLPASFAMLNPQPPHSLAVSTSEPGNSPPSLRTTKCNIALDGAHRSGQKESVALPDRCRAPWFSEL